MNPLRLKMTTQSAVCWKRQVLRAVKTRFPKDRLARQMCYIVIQARGVRISKRIMDSMEDPTGAISSRRAGTLPPAIEAVEGAEEAGEDRGGAEACVDGGYVPIPIDRLPARAPQ
jgi:hypothetical protein